MVLRFSAGSGSKLVTLWDLGFPLCRRRWGLGGPQKVGLGGAQKGSLNGADLAVIILTIVAAPADQGFCVGHPELSGASCTTVQGSWGQPAAGQPQLSN